jgi:hypothetical protein
MERISLKKLKDVEGKEQYLTLKSEIGLQLCKICMLRWKSAMLGKRLERISIFQPNRVQVFMNWRSIS